jgi:hypothetical protein
VSTCQVTPDCTAPAVARIAVIGEAVITRPITGIPLGYPSCADHLHHVIDVRLQQAMPAPSAEDLQR